MKANTQLKYKDVYEGMGYKHVNLEPDASQSAQVPVEEPNVKPSGFETGVILAMVIFIGWIVIRLLAGM